MARGSTGQVPTGRNPMCPGAHSGDEAIAGAGMGHASPYCLSSCPLRKSRLFFKYWHQEQLARSIEHLEKAAVTIQKSECGVWGQKGLILLETLSDQAQGAAPLQSSSTMGTLLSTIGTGAEKPGQAPSLLSHQGPYGMTVGQAGLGWRGTV